jgi:hypothetical protein
MDIKVGDEVRVVEPNYRRRHENRPANGYPGRVTKVAHKYATAEYEVPNGSGYYARTVEFEIANGRERASNSNYVTFVCTPEEMDRSLRRSAALDTLKAHFIEIKMGHAASFTLEQLEALAATAEEYEAGL